MRVAIGWDDAAVDLAQAIQAYLDRQRIVEVEGVAIGSAGDETVDAPDIAVAVASAIASGEADRGILLCGSGVGMVIAANKVPGIRAAQCHDVYTAEHSRTSNDAQILVMGSRAIGPELATRVVAAWLGAEFEPTDRRRRKMAKLDAIDRRLRRDPT